MSFWLDDITGDDAPRSQNICPNCTGTTFYDDPITNIPTCASCFMQSQTATQEEFGEDDAYALAGGAGTRIRSTSSVRSGGGKKKRGPKGRALSEYDRSKKLPDEEDCCDAFEWLLNDAARCVAKLIQLDDNSEQQTPTIESLQETVRDIWTRYKHQWIQATKAFSKKYPECRFAFRDFFLHNVRKAHVMRHVSISVGKQVEEEMIREMQMKYHDMDDDEFFRANMAPSETTARVSASEKHSGTNSKSTTTKRPKKKMRRTILTVGDLVRHAFPPDWKRMERYPNGIYEQHPYQAVVRIAPSLDLILSILQLALTHFKLGIAPYHLTSYVANGTLPHALNGYALLTPHMQVRVEMVKSFFVRSLVPPADTIQDLADLLATAIDWHGTEKLEGGIRFKIDPEECLYNVKLLADRMVQDLGFDKQVLTNALALMGNSSSQNAVGSHFLQRLNFANKLYTPLHVAALIVVACKFCPDWEAWDVINICSDSNKKSSNSSVPWSESQFQSLTNGRQIDHYLDFLGNTAFSANDDAPSHHMSDFFQGLDEDMPTTSSRVHTTFSPAKVAAEISNALITQLPDPGTNSARESESFVKGDIPTTSQLLKAVDDIYGESDKDTTTVKSLVASIKSHFGLSTVSKKMKSHIKERIALLNQSNQYDYVITYEVKLYKQKRFRRDESIRVVTRETSHSKYCQLLEYICYVIEEPNASKLHELVAEIESELFPKRTKKWVCKAEGCSSAARGGGYCVTHGKSKKNKVARHR